MPTVYCQCPLVTKSKAEVERLLPLRGENNTVRHAGGGREKV